MNTKEYRQVEFKKIDTQYNEYLPKIKIIKPNGETNWLDIKESELLEIKRVLLKTEGK